MVYVRTETRTPNFLTIDLTATLRRVNCIYYIYIKEYKISVLKVFNIIYLRDFVTVRPLTVNSYGGYITQTAYC